MCIYKHTTIRILIFTVMIKEFKLQDTVNTFDVQRALKDSFVDINKTVERPPIALSIGYDYNSNLNPTFTYGEMSAIIAPQKSKKSFFKRVLAATYIGGEAQNYFPNIQTLRKGDRFVLDFDTEQDKFYSHRAFKGVIQMVGNEYPFYLPYGIKKYTDDEMLQIIDTKIDELKDQIGMVFIDGIADLCFNPNDINKANEVINIIKKWTSYGIHLCCVIHKTFDKDKAFGHLGTYVQKKCETSIFLEVTDENDKNSPVKVKQKDSRGAPFDDFFFDLDLSILQPKECKEPKW